MINKIPPPHERWLHAEEMKAKLARADAWMQGNPPSATDINALETEALRRAAERAKSRKTAQKRMHHNLMLCE